MSKYGGRRRFPSSYDFEQRFDSPLCRANVGLA